MNKNAWNTFVYYLEYLSNEVCFCKHEPFKCFQKKRIVYIIHKNLHIPTQHVQTSLVLLC